MAAVLGAVQISDSLRKIEDKYGQTKVLKKHGALLSTNHWERQRSTDGHISCFPVSIEKLPLDRSQTNTMQLYAALKGPRGFGPSPKKTKRTKKTSKDDSSEDEEIEEDSSAGVIPEIVTNRMIGRMAFSVGIPLFIGLLFFPFFYYLKVGLKIDVPTWVPFIVSFIFFGTALLGVSYGIVSSSWDPMREGSLLGWNEAQKNWPVFWQSIWGRSGKK